MTRDNVIQLAREAGGHISSFHGRFVLYPDDLERFAALVAAHEREACARVCEAQRDARIETHPARVEFSDNVMALQCAAAIRARGES